ncbi:hypothetical protein TSUD_04720 [Trifolium subterraneum]|nr:hypothetical protein TSUD_04720 [Trifolium subterraneum]
MGGISNSTVSLEEAGMLVKALESDWAVLAEEIGLWIPVEVMNEEHNDKPDGADDSEEEVLPGKPLPQECKPELHTDYGGDAVRWGLTHHKDSAADCCQACLDHAKRAKEGEKKCNIWAEKPKLNFKDRYPEWYRNSRPSAPVIVPWASGVISA